MKKITLISACMLLFTAVSAEQMQFVTTMSAPVGNFARLDAADPTHVTRVGNDGDSSSGYLNFCNTRSSVGDIIIKGASAYLNQVNIQNGTTLGSTNTPEYRLGENLSIENGGTVTAGRIMANDVTFKDTNFHKSNVANTIYGNDISVMGGKTDNMEISSTAKINKSAQNSAYLDKEMEWSNEYQCDYNSSSNTEGESVWGTEYVDVKEYLQRAYYFAGKSVPWYLPDEEERKYDIQCDCVACFDEGSTQEDWSAYFPAGLCSNYGISGDQSSGRMLKEWVESHNEIPSYLELSNLFYSDTIPFNGAYGSNGQSWPVKNGNCITSDVGPQKLADRSKSYAIGCLIGTYGYNYCAFWNCRVKEPGEGTSQECTTPKYTSYLLKSKARVSTGGGDSGSGGNTCEDDTNRGKCESCGGTWNDSRCLCDCGWDDRGNSCHFNAKRGCVCGNLVRACR